MEIFQRAEMEEKINSLNLSEQKIFLFGHCNATEEICDYLTEKGFNVTAILDNNPNKIGNFYKEIKITSPQNILNSENAICLIANRHFETFKSQLLQLGYKGEIVKVVDFDTFSDFSVSENTIKEKTARMLRGKEILNEISLKYPKYFTVICPYKALGDVYWAMAFLPEYCKKHGIEKVLIVVIGKGCFEVDEMFGYKNIIMLGNAEMDEFVQAVIYEHQPNTLIAHHDKPYTDNIIKFLDKHFLSFTDYYKYAVYGLDKNANPAVPTVHENFSEKIAKNKTI
ncbi:MAG: hypothetical protein LBM93_05065, partial [Oscillospiraceae bacterium]|nr:hypothetical protein [Oscillospiraceae bacterium]